MIHLYTAPTPNGWKASVMLEETGLDYTVHAIDDTLDAERIEARAKQLLFQALNRRQLVAFVGSGISTSYGRLGWNEWLDRQIETEGIQQLTAPGAGGKQHEA